MSIFNRINDGEFTNSVAYPSRPQTPELLRKQAKELTLDEISTLPGLKASFEAALSESSEQMKQYHLANADCEARFRAALAEECGTAGHPKEALLFEKAWEEGHSSGYSEVANYYVSFADLIQ